MVQNVKTSSPSDTGFQTDVKKKPNIFFSPQTCQSVRLRHLVTKTKDRFAQHSTKYGQDPSYTDSFLVKEN